MLKRTPTGINEEDKDFKEVIAYYKLENDLQSLKDEGWIRSVKSNKNTIIFPCDKELEKIEVRDQYPKKSLSLI